MRRLARVILVGCTAFAALVAASLQGKVLCYADGGRHVAVEAPHPERIGGAAHHDHHCESDSSHEPEHDRCTDVSADFSATREASSRSTQFYHVDLILPPVVPLMAFTVPADLAPLSLTANDQPPGPPGLSCLRTIILLV